MKAVACVRNDGGGSSIVTAIPKKKKVTKILYQNVKWVRRR
jgi:hypothetical protein